MRNLLLIVVAALLVSGCKSMDRSAFVKGKVYAVAVVGIVPEHEVKLYSGPKTVTVDPQKLIPKNKATNRYADKIAAQYVKGLRKYAPVKIISGNRVTNRRVYKKFQSIDKSKLTKKHVATRNYHNYWLDDFKHMPRLAKQLGVDGVLLIYLTAASHKTGKYTPAVEVFLEGYSATGKRVLRYNLRYVSDIKKDEIGWKRDASHFRLLNESIANKHAYLAGIDTARRVWGIKGK